MRNKLWLLAVLAALPPGACNRARDEAEPFVDAAAAIDAPPAGAEVNATAADAAAPGTDGGVERASPPVAAVDAATPDRPVDECPVCPERPNTETTCQNRACLYRCHPGFGACGGDRTAIGCPTALLESPTNCGVCGRRCDEGTCAGGTCPARRLAGPLSARMPGSDHPTMDGDTLYFVDWDTYSISAIGKDGSNKRRLIDIAALVPSGFGLGDYLQITTDRQLLWVVGNLTEPRSIAVYPLGVPNARARVVVRDIHRPTNIGLVAPHVYWSRLIEGDDAHFMIERAALADGSRQQLVITDLDQFTDKVVFDQSGVYFTRLSKRVIAKLVPGQGSVPFYESKSGFIELLGAHLGHLYWLEGRTRVWRQPLGLPPTAELVTTVDADLNPAWVAFAGGTLYAFARQAVLAIPAEGGPAAVLTRLPETAYNAYGLDDRYLYWADEPGALFRVVRW